MQENGSLILDVLLFLGVLYALYKIVAMKHQKNDSESSRSAQSYDDNYVDEVVSVRRVPLSPKDTQTNDNQPPLTEKTPISAKSTNKPHTQTHAHQQIKARPRVNHDASPETPQESLMFLLHAKNNQILGGYDVLQALLAAGMRFGEGQLFHRYQKKTGQGPILFSLAAASEKGTFDLQNMTSFNVKGLCLFMYISNHQATDLERFDCMHQTALDLSEKLNTHLLNDKHEMLTDSNFKHYIDKIHAPTDTMSSVE